MKRPTNYAAIARANRKRTRKPVKLTPVRDIPHYAVITRAIWERGATQAEALAELDRRGLWLSPDQRKQAGLKGL
jgi:hypothetical protein